MPAVNTVKPVCTMEAIQIKGTARAIYHEDTSFIYASGVY